jgi:hypothetical protein
MFNDTVNCSVYTAMLKDGRMSMAHRCNGVERGNRSTMRQPIAVHCVSHKSNTDCPGIEIGSSRWQKCGDRIATTVAISRKAYVGQSVGRVSWNITVAIAGRHSTSCLCTSSTRWLQPDMADQSPSRVVYLFTARNIINHLQLWRQLLMFMSSLLSEGPRNTNGCT